MPYIAFGKFDPEHPETLEDADVEHKPRTLDQYTYYSTGSNVTKRRDCDQVVTRFLDSERGRPSSELTVLRICQLWLWIVDDSMLLLINEIEVS